MQIARRNTKWLVTDFSQQLEKEMKIERNDYTRLTVELAREFAIALALECKTVSLLDVHLRAITLVRKR